MYDLSVILPVYNVEQYLASCLDSLLAQSFQGLTQVILVEDQSPDNSLLICQEYAEKYKNITLIEHTENGGSAVARNSGLEHATGKYFVFIDPDDLLPVTALETLYYAIDSSGADIVKGNNTSFKEEGLEPKLVSYSVAKREDYYDDGCLTVLLEHEKLRGHPWGKIFRTATFLEDRFTPGYRMAQDLLYCTQVFKKARHVLLIPDIVYQYRIHRGGATGRKYETGAYLSWIKCIGEIQHYVTTKSQISAYQGLKIRTLVQLAKEIRFLRGTVLISVLKTVNQTTEKWLPSFWKLLFSDRISITSMVRYMRFCLVIRKVHRLK